MKPAVLDASALLALLQEEPGGSQVEAFLPGSAISTVNLAEVVGKLSDGGMPEEAIRTAVGSLGLEIVPFDEEMSYKAGLLYPSTHRRGLSLGDRACLSLAVSLNRPAVTADRTWSRLKLGIDVQAIR